MQNLNGHQVLDKEDLLSSLRKRLQDRRNARAGNVLRLQQGLQFENDRLEEQSSTVARLQEDCASWEESVAGLKVKHSNKGREVFEDRKHLHDLEMDLKLSMGLFESVKLFRNEGLWGKCFSLIRIRELLGMKGIDTMSRASLIRNGPGHLQRIVATLHSMKYQENHTFKGFWRKPPSGIPLFTWKKYCGWKAVLKQDVKELEVLVDLIPLYLGVRPSWWAA